MTRHGLGSSEQGKGIGDFRALCWKQKYSIFFHFDFIPLMLMLLGNILEIENKNWKWSSSMLLKSQSTLSREPLAEPSGSASPSLFLHSGLEPGTSLNHKLYPLWFFLGTVQLFRALNHLPASSLFKGFETLFKTRTTEVWLVPMSFMFPHQRLSQWWAWGSPLVPLCFRVMPWRSGGL